MSTPVAILAGGLATRLHPITTRIPKALVDVGGRPFAEHQIALLRRRGLTDIVFLVGYLGGTIRDELGDGSRWDVRIRYVFDGDKPLGTGGALVRALPELGETFFVLYGDSYLECDYHAAERAFLDSGKHALMTVFRNDGQWDRSNVQFEHGRILRYDKHEPGSDARHIDYGLGLFHRDAFAGRRADEPCDLAMIYADLLAQDDLAGFEVRERFYEIGSPAGLEATRAYLATKENGA